MNNHDPILTGLHWLDERDGHADATAIARQIDLACEPWTMALRTLRDYPDVVLLLHDLYPHVIPYLIKGSGVSPVHHIAYVVQFMATIAVGERLAPHDVKRGVLAALFHDIGIGDATRPKISERMILEETDPVKKDHLRREGIASRREHMEKGVEITDAILRAYRRQHMSLLTDEDVTVILDIVGTHDHGKIPLMEPTVDPQWLLRPGPDDWLKQCHWEADALWMLCPAGLLIDMQRRQATDTPEERRAQFLFNLNLHREIVTKYAEAFHADGTFAQYGFRDGLLYRSVTGYELACGFRAALGCSST